MSSVTGHELICDLLRRNGPTSSSSLAKHLVQSGLSPEAARQQISRTKDPVWRLPRIRFARNGRFVYLKDQDRTEAFYAAFRRACRETDSAYGAVIEILAARGGVCAEKQFGVLCGCPTARRGQISAERLKENLKSFGAISDGNVPGIGPSVWLNGLLCPTAGPPVIRARLTAERVLIDVVKEWMRRLGLASWDAVKTREDPDRRDYSGFAFDVVGPSYIRALTTSGPDSLLPGFAVADIHLGFEMNLESMDYFIRKLAIARSGRSRPVLGMLLAESFSNEAWQRSRREGLVSATPEIMFGKGVAQGLRELISTLTNAATAAIKNPEIVAELWAKLGAIEGAASNLRGPLFEMIVAHLVGSEGGWIDIGKTAFSVNRNRMADIDVLRVRKMDVAAYECRGHGPGYEEKVGAVKKWLEEKVPTIRDHLLGHPDCSNKPQTFHYWTTGNFSADALEFLNEAKGKTQKYEIAWKDGGEVLALARGQGAKRIVDTLNEHYARHPLAVVA